MDQSIIDLIQNIGFPIACTVALFKMLNDERSAHAEESKNFSKSIDNNTSVMQQILEAIRGGNKQDDP